MQGELFLEHSKKFSDAALETMVGRQSHPGQGQLRTELSLIYVNEEFKGCSGAVALFQVMMENNLQDTFTETKST